MLCSSQTVWLLGSLGFVWEPWWEPPVSAGRRGPRHFERMTPRMIPTVLQYDVCMTPCLRWRPALAVAETAEEGMTSERAMSPRKSAPNFISTGGNRTASTYLTDRRSSQA